MLFLMALMALLLAAICRACPSDPAFEIGANQRCPGRGTSACSGRYRQPAPLRAIAFRRQGRHWPQLVHPP